MGPIIPPLPILSCETAFWITTYLVSTISTTSIADYICSTVQLNLITHNCIQQYSRKKISQ